MLILLQRGRLGWRPLSFLITTKMTLMARFCRERTGRACLLCPGISDVDLFRYREGIIHLNAKVSDGAFDLGVAEQELHSP